jgi:hypothetical protein
LFGATEEGLDVALNIGDGAMVARTRVEVMAAVLGQLVGK